ncbi:13566_t:CDS:2, partial [Racocetra persica]
MNNEESKYLSNPNNEISQECRFGDKLDNKVKENNKDLSNKNSKVKIYKMNSDEQKENVKGKITINKRKNREMFEVKNKNDEYISISSIEIAQSYDNKINSSKNIIENRSYDNSETVKSQVADGQNKSTNVTKTDNDEDAKDLLQ